MSSSKLKVILVAFDVYPSLRVAALRPTYVLRHCEKRDDISVAVVKPPDSAYRQQSISHESRSYSEYIVAAAKQSGGYLSKLFELFSWVKTVNSAIREESADTVVYSCGPFYYLFSVLFVPRKIRIVIDFRDPWYLPGADGRDYGTLFARLLLPIAMNIQGLILRRADAVVNVMPELTQLYRTTYPRQAAEKFHTVYNGFDESALTRIDSGVSIPRDETVRIGIAGKFAYYNRDDASMLALAIKESGLAEKFSVVQIGEDDQTRAAFDENGLGGLFFLLGYRAYVDTLSICAACDILLVNSRNDYQLPTKAFDYIAVNKPVMGILKKGNPIDKILAPFPYYYRVDTPEELKRLLKDIVAERPKTLHNMSAAETMQYSREARTANLVSLFFPQESK